MVIRVYTVVQAPTLWYNYCNYTRNNNKMSAVTRTNILVQLNYLSCQSIIQYDSTV